MAYAKRIIAVLLTTLLLILTLPISICAATTNDVHYGRTLLSQMSNSQSLLYAYDSLVTGCAQANGQPIKIKHSQFKIDEQELELIYQLLRNDYPEYFWLEPNCKYQYEGNAIVSVTPEYKMTGSALTNAKNTFESKMNNLVSAVKGKSDYEKAHDLHDKIASTVCYDFSTQRDQSAYTAITQGKAVCAGYSKAYQYALQKAGIPAISVIGSSFNPTTHNEEPHEWTLACINGKWYYTDVTWDDQERSLFHAYFNITTKQLLEDHKINVSSYNAYQKWLPAATSDDDNYFKKNNHKYQHADADELVRELKKGNNKLQLFVDGKVDDFIGELNNVLPTVAANMGAVNGAEFNLSALQIGHELQLTVNIIEAGHQHVSLTHVPAKAATCTTTGNSAYYICTCQKWFSNADATTEITDHSSVTLDAVPHTPSSWKSDASAHWKQCTKCGAEIANSRDKHSDSDNNSKCDVCAATINSAVAVTTTTGANKTEVPESKSDEVSSTVHSATSNLGDDADQQQTQTPDDVTPDDTVNNSHEAEYTSGDAGEKSFNKTLVIAAIIVSTIVVASIIAGVVIYIKKKRMQP